MTIGSIYVAVSESFPADSKIGFTLRPVPERMAELQRQYRTRHPFRAFNCMLVKHPRRVEWWAHRHLAQYRNPRTELFECAPAMAWGAVLWAIDKVIEEERRNPQVFRPRPERAPQRWRRARLSYQEWLVAIAFAAPLIAWLVAGRPALPDWMPASVLYTADLTRRFF